MLSNVPNIVFALIFIHVLAWIIILTKKDRVVIDLISDKIRELKSGHEASEWLNRLQFPEQPFDPSELILLDAVFDKFDSVELRDSERIGWNDLGEMSDGTESSKDQSAAGLHPAGDQDDK